MGIETYTIQKGDTLTKIAREHYGLSGNEAYQKALEIAKDNNIANPNLIYAGASLNLLFDDEPQKECNGRTGVEKQNAGKEDDIANKYQELIKKQKDYYQYQDAQELYTEAPEGFNPEKDSKVIFAKPEIFETKNVQEKVEAYKEAALELANQDIEANDTEDETGKKDGQISFEEFEKTQMEFFESSQAAAMKLRAEDQFTLEYLEQYGYMPTEDLIAAKGKEIYESKLTEYKASISDMFNAFDIDNSGYLDSTEVATQYVFMDASTTASDNAIKVMGDNGNILMAFDGEINFDDQAIFVKNANEAQEYQKLFGTDYIPVYYTNDKIKEIHKNMFAA